MDNPVSAPARGGASTAWPRNPARATLLVILLTLPARLAVAALSGLGFGESYYMLGVVRPQLSYFDQPPLAFWLGWLSVQAGGAVSALILRLPFILCFAVTTWLMFLLGRRLFGPLAGFYAALLLNLSAVFTVTTASWLQPDAPLMLFWLATALCLVHIFRLGRDDPRPDTPEAVRAGSLKWWLLAGLLLGLTTLSKYHAAFLFAGAGLCALTCRPLRHWLWHPGPYLALALNFLVASPVFIWNQQHHWVSFLFQGGRAGGEFALHWDWLAGSLAGQALWLLPWIWLPLVLLLADCFRRGPGDRARWFCACTAILPIVFFTVVTLWAKLGFHFHWQAPGYLMLFPVLGVTVANWMQSAVLKRRVWTRRWLWLSGLACALVMAVLQVHAATGCWSRSLLGPAWWAGLFHEEDPTLEGFDYDALRERCAAEGWDRDPNVFLAATRWHQGGKAGWALRGEKPVLVLHDDPRNLAFLVDQNELLGRDAVLIAREEFTTETRVREITAGIFAEVKRLPDLEIVRGGVKEFSVPVYYCRKMLKKYEYPEWYGR